MEKGTKVYFRKNSGMNFAKNSGLIVNGVLDDEVIFRGDRSDTKYDTLPANWNGIKMEEGSLLNMNYARIFGGNVGLQLKKNDAKINNTIIHTFQNIGIYGIAADITANNLVMNNCGEADLGIFKGGTYTITHSTLANYWQMNGAMPGLGIYATNEYVNRTTTEQGALNLNIRNTIVYGEKDNSIQFKATTGQTF
ncbi:MAG: hypothetical protein J0I88_03780, partial [Chryseobacterium sp.]|nr:hypothetical protein [Chryseobacterium sp.]